MLGFSVYLAEELTDNQYQYLASMQNHGFTGVFTSLHIPEDDPKLVMTRFQRLVQWCKTLNLELTCDLSLQGLGRLHLSYDDLLSATVFKNIGLRIDDGFSLRQIAQLSQQTKVMLNASTITVDELVQLRQFQADFSNLEAWHNYYPRPETGLSAIWLSEKNEWLQQQGLRTMAFVAGDAGKRGPIYTGLPTLECDRQRHPLIAIVDLLKKWHTDNVYIGDPELSVLGQQQISAYFEQRALVLPITTTHHFLYRQDWHSRPDIAAQVVRLIEGRVQLGTRVIHSNNTVERCLGTITQDNERYGRYMGELQICRTNLTADQRVNVIGHVAAHSQTLLALVRPKQTIRFIKENIHEEEQ
ncbi:MupG family TIM beta-alpha barrel fold protein [Loigolactobacillus coryniformis]|uniref:PTS-associated protein n=1 Tax=Loigolactobacillus coryniformis subsp. coryniformis CECT 5711 TaxID=1185325 RepID=J3JB76_9LACO|nr:MupG family TIM beta-alpha barrel fold protein [Loigolactobacillus coryniformis]EJN55487.1 PTS-associated protein [Loigolactobacillus coryniformis subsp. coryniformis CECT 5711]